MEGRDAIIEFRELEPWGDIGPVAIESTMVRFIRALRELSDDLGPGEVCLASAPRLRHALLAEVLGTTVHVGCGSNQFRFAAKALDRRLSTADPLLHRLSVMQCERAPRRVSGGEPLLERLEREIASGGDWHVSMDRAARRLGMSQRTLRRRLTELGQRYQDVLDEQRRKAALDLLVTTRDSVDSLAERLGYADVAGFRRAVRRWTGASPAAYRRASRAVR